MDVVRVFDDFDQQRNTDLNVEVVKCEDSHFWILINEVLHGDQVLGLGERGAAKQTGLSVPCESPTVSQHSDGLVRAIPTSK